MTAHLDFSLTHVPSLLKEAIGRLRDKHIIRLQDVSNASISPT